MSDNFIASFRWMFRDELVRRAYAEGELVPLGNPYDRRYLLRVYLVRDEMPRPQQDKIIDPEIREGVRIYVGTITDDENLSILAHLAPVQGQQMAYRMIYTAIKDSPQAVEKYDDEWLSDLMQEKVSA